MIVFEPIEHSYKENQTEYESVTSFLKTFEPVTDWDTIAERYVSKGREETFKKLAKKNNKPVEYFEKLFEGVEMTGQALREYWMSKGQGAAEDGTFVHAYFEALDLQNHPRVHPAVEKDGLKYSVDLEKLESGVYPELIVYSRKYGLAGQIDRLEIFEDGYFVISDFKTDKEINFEAPIFYNPLIKQKTYSTYKHPISHLQLCNWNKYQLQLSLYATMLESYGYKMRDLEIHHVISERDEDGRLVKENNKPKILDVNVYPVEFLKTDIKSLLKLKNDRF